MVVFFGMSKKSMKCNLAGGYADGTRPIIHHVNAGMHIHLYLMWKRNRTIRASELLSIAIRCEIHIAFAWFKLIIVIYPHMTLDYWSWYLSWLYFTVLHSYPSLLSIFQWPFQEPKTGISPQNMAYMVQYLHFRILEFPLNFERAWRDWLRCARPGLQEISGGKDESCVEGWMWKPA